jgi:hypothetical protein
MNHASRLVIISATVALASCGTNSALTTVPKAPPSFDVVSAPDPGSLGATPGHVAARAVGLTLVGESLMDESDRAGILGTHVRTALYVVGSSADTRLDVQLVAQLPTAKGSDADALNMPDRTIEVKVRGKRGLAKVFEGDGAVLAWIERPGYTVDLTGWNLSVDELLVYADSVSVPDIDDCLGGKCPPKSWWHATAEAEKFPGSGPSYSFEGDREWTAPEKTTSITTAKPSS